MPADGGQAGQNKSTTVAASRLDEKARDLLQAILPESIESGFEKGAVICRAKTTGALSSTEVRTGTIKHTVDVGLGEWNCGCPEGTEPVAYYHTHPTPPDSIDPASGMRGSPDFSDDDKFIAWDSGIVAYVAGHDGTMRRYNPPPVPTVMVEGRPVRTIPTDEEGKVLPIPDVPVITFNWTLKTKK